MPAAFSHGFAVLLLAFDDLVIIGADNRRLWRSSGQDFTCASGSALVRGAASGGRAGNCGVAGELLDKRPRGRLYNKLMKSIVS